MTKKYTEEQIDSIVGADEIFLNFPELGEQKICIMEVIENGLPLDEDDYEVDYDGLVYFRSNKKREGVIPFPFFEPKEE